jgi:putative transposase
MKQTMVLKRAPTPDQHAALLETLPTFNDACNYAAEIASTTRTRNKFALQKLGDAPRRIQDKWPAQMARRAIRKTIEASQRDKSVKPTFRPEGAIVYAARMMSFTGGNTSRS